MLSILILSKYYIILLLHFHHTKVRQVQFNNNFQICMARLQSHAIINAYSMCIYAIK